MKKAVVCSVAKTSENSYRRCYYSRQATGGFAEVFIVGRLDMNSQTEGFLTGMVNEILMNVLRGNPYELYDIMQNS